MCIRCIERCLLRWCHQVTVNSCVRGMVFGFVCALECRWTFLGLWSCSKSVRPRRSLCSKCSVSVFGVSMSIGITAFSRWSCLSLLRQRSSNSSSKTWPKFAKWETNRIRSRSVTIQYDFHLLCLDRT